MHLYVFLLYFDAFYKVMSFSEQKLLKYDACRQNLASWNSHPDPADPADPPDRPDPAEMRYLGRVRPWVLHTPGARMTVVNTNSLKIGLIELKCIRIHQKYINMHKYT